MLRSLLLTAVAAPLLALAGCGEAPGPGDARTVIVGSSPTFPPFESKDVNGDTVGFDIDLFRAIAADRGFEPEFRDVGFDALIPSLQGGQIDVAVSGISITEERSRVVDFTDAYMNAGLVIATAPGSDIEGPGDLAGKRVGVNLGTTGAGAAEALAAEGKIGSVQTFEDTGLSMEALVAGKVDAVVNDKPVVEAFVRGRPDEIRMLPAVLEADDYGMAVRKGNVELLAELNAGLAAVRASGEMERIRARWFDAEPAAE